MPGTIKFKQKPCFQFTVVGAGATGSHFIRGLCQDIRSNLDAYRSDSCPFNYQHIMLIDGDIIEEKNLGNQLFDADEIGSHKVKALAERYGDHYNLEVLWSSTYVKDCEELSQLS